MFVWYLRTLQKDNISTTSTTTVAAVATAAATASVLEHHAAVHAARVHDADVLRVWQFTCVWSERRL